MSITLRKLYFQVAWDWFVIASTPEIFNKLRLPTFVSFLRLLFLRKVPSSNYISAVKKRPSKTLLKAARVLRFFCSHFAYRFIYHSLSTHMIDCINTY